jgi:hypothetical protein
MGCFDAHRVSSSLLGPVDPSFRALSRRLTFTVRRHKFNAESLPFADEGGEGEDGQLQRLRPADAHRHARRPQGIPPFLSFAPSLSHTCSLSRSLSLSLLSMVSVTRVG